VVLVYPFSPRVENDSIQLKAWEVGGIGAETQWTNDSILEYWIKRNPEFQLDNIHIFSTLFWTKLEKVVLLLCYVLSLIFLSLLVITYSLFLACSADIQVLADTLPAPAGRARRCDEVDQGH
jgi:hypothetical protein